MNKLSKKQRIILALLAVADVVVIALMAGYAVTTTLRGRRANRFAASMPVVGAVELPACSRYLLETLALPGQPAEVSVKNGEVWAQISISPERDDTTPQVLWLILDRLDSEFTDACSGMTTLTLAVSITDLDGTDIRRYVAQVETDALIRWLRSEIDEDDFAAVIRYRSL